ncbi:MAG: hypothetical protein J3K34DRAFT_399422 [Monoraphidium minutum]|nr:MAG: hypothetical protein J3K34DRAFT_399422 [Monoraphidium minutum]
MGTATRPHGWRVRTTRRPACRSPATFGAWSAAGSGRRSPQNWRTGCSAPPPAGAPAWPAARAWWSCLRRCCRWRGWPCSPSRCCCGRRSSPTAQSCGGARRRTPVSSAPRRLRPAAAATAVLAATAATAATARRPALAAARAARNTRFPLTPL